MCHKIHEELCCLPVTLGTGRHFLRSNAMAKPYAKEVLIVEDEALIRMVAADTLADHGITAWEAENAHTALDVLARHPEIGLVFTDMHMPGQMSGLDLVRQVHQTRPDVKLIVTSGGMVLANDDIPDHGTFLPKPYPLEKLVTLVSAQLAS